MAKNGEHEARFCRLLHEAGELPVAVTRDELLEANAENPLFDLLDEAGVDRSLEEGTASLLVPPTPLPVKVCFIDRGFQGTCTWRWPTLTDVENVADLEERAWVIYEIRLSPVCERSAALVRSVADAGFIGASVQAGFNCGPASEEDGWRQPRKFFGRRRGSAAHRGPSLLH